MTGPENAAARDARPLLIFPYNGNGREALDCLGDAYHCVGFVDDTPDKQGTDAHGHRVFDRAALAARPDAAVLAVPGSATSYRSRRDLIDGLGVDPDRFARVVHPSARISPTAVVGDHVCVLPNTVIHHDAEIGAWTLIGSNVTIAGGTVVGENCYIGSGSSVMNGLRLGDEVLVGMGTTVIRNVPAGARVVGNPARQLGRRDISA
jgi:UDP-3-O-[3-hydroxymyristoyl] glucosamine N-acyltransferase